LQPHWTAWGPTRPSTSRSALVGDRNRIVTIAAAERAKSEGFIAIVGSMPASQAYRDSVRADLVRLAGEGRLVVPIARTVPLAGAVEATAPLMGGHPGGELALTPSARRPFTTRHA
jgi:hypothetical protein